MKAMKIKGTLPARHMHFDTFRYRTTLITYWRKTYGN